MSNRIDPDRKRTRNPKTSRSGKPKPLDHDAAVAKTKGTGDPVQQRWTVHAPGSDAASPHAVVIAGNTHVVFIATRLWVDARSVARIYLSRLGVGYDYLDNFEVKSYTPNGWTPKRAVLVTPLGADIMVELFDFEALQAEAEAEAAKEAP